MGDEKVTRCISLNENGAIKAPFSLAQLGDDTYLVSPRAMSI